MGSGLAIRRAIKKYGIENFEKTILIECESEDDMYDRESEIVSLEFVERVDTYNLIQGGRSGIVDGNLPEFRKKALDTLFSNYTRDELVAHGKYVYQSLVKTYGKDVVKQWQSDGGKVRFLGKHHTDEAKQKIGKANSINQRGKSNSQYGTMWITKDRQNKKIKRIEYDEWTKNGWEKGRYMN